MKSGSSMGEIGFEKTLNVFNCAQMCRATSLVLLNIYITETHYLRVFGYSSEEGAEFTICIWNAPMPTNGVC